MYNQSCGLLRHPHREIKIDVSFANKKLEFFFLEIAETPIQTTDPDAFGNMPLVICLLIIVSVVVVLERTWSSLLSPR